MRFICMPRVLPTVAMLALAGCGGSDPEPAGFVPARDLSLKELSALRPEIERVVVRPPRPAPSAYQDIEAAVRGRSLERMEAETRPSWRSFSVTAARFQTRMAARRPRMSCRTCSCPGSASGWTRIPPRSRRTFAGSSASEGAA
jgi:hypothetical protein